MSTQCRIVCARYGDQRHSYHVYAYGSVEKARAAVELLNNDQEAPPIPARRGCKPWVVQTRHVGPWTEDAQGRLV